MPKSIPFSSSPGLLTAPCNRKNSCEYFVASPFSIGLTIRHSSGRSTLVRMTNVSSRNPPTVCTAFRCVSFNVAVQPYQATVFGSRRRIIIIINHIARATYSYGKKYIYSRGFSLESFVCSRPPWPVQNGTLAAIQGREALNADDLRAHIRDNGGRR